MLKREDSLDFYPCIADTVLDVSDDNCQKFGVETVFIFIQQQTAAYIHIVNQA